MKKTILIAAVSIFAIGSAFSTKAFFNPTGWAHVGTQDVSGVTDDPACQVQSTGTNCTIVVNGNTVPTVYDLKADIGVSSKILRHN